MLENLVILTNCSDMSLLNILINQCKDFACDYCNLSEYITDLDSIVTSMVCEKYSKLYSEGINSKSYSGITESYTDDFSPAIYKALRKHRKLRRITNAE